MCNFEVGEHILPNLPLIVFFYFFKLVLFFIPVSIKVSGEHQNTARLFRLHPLLLTALITQLWVQLILVKYETNAQQNAGDIYIK